MKLPDLLQEREDKQTIYDIPTGGYTWMGRAPHKELALNVYVYINLVNVFQEEDMSPITE